MKRRGTHLETGEKALTRRAFLERGSLCLAGAAGLAAGPWLARAAARGEDGAPAALKVGILTDVHYADKPPSGTRHYRDALGRVEKAVSRLNELRADLAIEVGDLVDAAPTAPEELAYLARIDRAFEAFKGPRHYVLGNHCVHTLSKEEFIGHCGAKKPFYSFDQGGFHFVVLDACFRSDGTPYGRGVAPWDDSDVPEAERRWLEDDLRKTELDTLVFVHQRVDLDPPSPYAVKSAAAVRKALEASGKVLAVFQGHHHVNDLREVGGIHYVTLPAVVDGAGEERNAFALLEVHAGGSMRLTGFGETKSREKL